MNIMFGGYIFDTYEYNIVYIFQIYIIIYESYISRLLDKQCVVQIINNYLEIYIININWARKCY